MGIDGYVSRKDGTELCRRKFLKIGCGVGAGIILGTPPIWSGEKKERQRIKTNIEDVLSIPRMRYSIPGPFPGKVVEVHDSGVLKGRRPDPDIVNRMIEKGITNLTGKDLNRSFKMFFSKSDVIGIKVNPVGGGLISTHTEVVSGIIDWLLRNGVKRSSIVIWDRFDYMLKDAGFTPERYPGIKIEGLQTMDENAAAAARNNRDIDNSRWLDKNGHHVSESNFDKNVYYWADVEGPKDLPYLNQHVFNGKYSYFGKLLTQKLTKIINVAVFKNTGNGISMATKNIGYGSICNTNRLHRPLFFDVCTEVMAFPVIRDKLMINIVDGLIGQYEGGPAANVKFQYNFNRLFFATDPIALDRLCHDLIVKKRKEMKIRVNEHPIYAEYLRYGERLGLGIGHLERINRIIV